MNRYMTRTMPGQMYDFKWTNAHVHGLISEINGNRLVDGFCKTVDVEKRGGFLISESGFSEERGTMMSSPMSPRRSKPRTEILSAA